MKERNQENTSERIGKRIKEARKTGMVYTQNNEWKFLTQEELADELKVTPQAVSLWENGNTTPDIDNLVKLAVIYGHSVSWFVEDRMGYDEFETQKIFYDWERMKTRVQAIANERKMENTLKALPYAVQAHEGQHLKNAPDIPYISHPLNMACHLLAMNIRDDAIIAATLLHDVIEDCGKSSNELPVDEETKELVVLMTHAKSSDEKEREGIIKKYYEGLSSNPKAALIKLVDRCNNLTKMSWGLRRERQLRMIDETVKYILPLLDVIKNTEYDDAKWLLSYQLNTTLDIYKRLI